MRRTTVSGTRWLAACLGTAALLCTTALSAQPQVQVPAPRRDQTIRRDTLPNGMTVVVVENHAVPLATAHVVFRGGAMTQTPELEGVPHLFEHMLFKSYSSIDNASFSQDASLAKASYNGATSDEEVSYTLWFPSDELGTNLSLMATLVRDPDFKNKELQMERFVVRNEMQRAQSQPSFLLATAAAQALWGDWFSRKNTIGNDLALFAVTAERLKTIYATWYVPNNAALVVTGDVDPEKVFNEARKHFGRWRRANDPIKANPVPVPPPLDSTYAFVYTHDVQTITVQLSWRGPTLARDSTDVADARTLADLLNADESPFQRQLVDAGLFRSARLSADINRNGSELRFTGITSVDQITNALGGLGTVLDQLVSSEYFDASALVVDAKRDRVARALAYEETASLASSLGSAWAIGRLGGLSQDGTTASAPTRESIAAFVSRWISKRPYVIGALTPVGTETSVGTALAQYIAFMK